MVEDGALAATLAGEAGELLLALRGQGDPSTLGSRGDRKAHRLLIRRLRELRGADAVVSEEGEAPSHLGTRFWLVDPLDGTREYAERDREDWAVHVALIVERIAVVGAVALPARGLVLSSVNPPQLPGAPATPLRILVSRTRPPSFATALASAVGGTLVPLGSAGAKTAAVVCGEADAYVHDGGQREWDSAAPVAVAQAAGMHVSRLDGSPVRYGNPDFALPDLLVAHPACAEAILGAVGPLRAPA